MKRSYSKSLVFCAGIGLISQIGHAATIAWQGTGGNWSDGTKWVGGTAPSQGGGDNVTFSSTASGDTAAIDPTGSTWIVDNFNYATSSSSSHSFTIASGKTLKIADGGVMSVGDLLTFPWTQSATFSGLGTLQLGTNSVNKASKLNIGTQLGGAGWGPTGTVTVGTALDLNVDQLNVGMFSTGGNAVATGTLTATGAVTGNIGTATVGYSAPFNNSGGAGGIGTVDFSTATVNNLAFGTLTIGDRSSAAAYWKSQGTVKLGSGTSSASTLVVGTTDLLFGGNTGVTTSGLLVLKGNSMAVSGSVSILGEKFTTGVGSTGEIQTRVEGTSAGLALTSGATLSLTNHLNGATSLTDNNAKLTIFFDNDPTTVIGQSIYYGFSWAGNHLSALQALNNSGIDGFANTIDDRLIWNVSGLSLANQSRVGIFYNNLDNTTYVGWIPEPSSLSVLALGGLLATRRKR